MNGATLTLTSVAPAQAGAHPNLSLRTAAGMDPRLRGGDEPECSS